MINLLAAHRRRRAVADDGFTLIELLVVITILGILAAVVVFSVAGIGDKGQDASKNTELTVLRTAEEAYCAKNGVYATQDQLKSGGFLASDPGYSSVVKTNTGNCGGTGFVLGTPTFTGAADSPRVLAAANNTPGFTYLGQSFTDDNGPVQFLFGASGGLSTIANGGTGAGSDDALFASADEANVNKTIAKTDTVAGGAAGACTGTCRGIGSSKTLYAMGRLVVYACKGGGKTLTPAETNHTGCAAPSGGYLGTAPTTAADAVTLLTNNPSFKLAIANPGALPPSTTSPPTAPYGLAAYQALTSNAAGGGGLSAGQFNAFVSSGQIVYGANVSATQTIVQTGNAQMAMIPKSFEVSPAGNDTNNWTTIDSGLHDPIKQWAVVLSGGSASDQAQGKKFLDYVVSPTGQAVLATFGYQPLS